MDSIPGALSSIKDRGLRMRLMLLSLTLGLSPDDKVICRGIEVLENTQDAVSAHIDTNRISFVISIRSTLNGRRTFIRIGRSENDGYQRNLIEKIISTAMARQRMTVPVISGNGVSTHTSTGSPSSAIV